MFQYHIFPRSGLVTVKRPPKFGGDREFLRFEDLEEAYRKGEIHPLDLKKTAGRYLTEILSCVRDSV